MNSTFGLHGVESIVALALIHDLCGGSVSLHGLMACTCK